ncbi:MAG: MBL fold metallo-hydrolase [Clostridia bacterium]|nr:MBL fold metallo-hydrolase [Clostridia bacterium]
MKICTLYSGSSGNVALLKADNCNILIDCGVGYRSTVSALNSKGINPRSIDAIFITHAHGDHINGIYNYVHFNPTVNIFVHNEGYNEFKSRTGCHADTFNSAFDYKGLQVDFCQCYHDVDYCNGYSFSQNGQRICYVTDTGCYDDAMVEFIKGTNVLVLESNHDKNMLISGIYSPMLKRRILSVCGHLSNDQAGELMSKTLNGNTKSVILAHLSENNNLPSIALKSARKVIDDMGLTVNLVVATQSAPSIEVD